MAEKLVRLDDNLAKDIEAIAKEFNNGKLNDTYLKALRAYRDMVYMESKASIINEEIIKVLQASLGLLEQRLNNKTNQLLSELAIQEAVICLVVAESLDVEKEKLTQYRRAAIDFLKANNRILRLEELIT